MDDASFSSSTTTSSSTFFFQVVSMTSELVAAAGMDYLQRRGVFQADYGDGGRRSLMVAAAGAEEEEGGNSHHEQVGADGEKAELLTEPAVLALFAWLVVEIALTLGSYHQVLRNAPAWQAHLEEGKQTIAYAAVTSCLTTFLVVVVGGLLGVSLTTRDLNPNTVVVLRGISLVVASIVFLVISLRVGRRWLGIKYRYTVRGRENDAWEVEFYSFKALRFHVRWSCTMPVISIFIPLLLFFCGETLVMLYTSVIGGFMIGAIVVALFFVDTSKWVSKCWRIIVAIVLALSLSVISAFLFAEGCYYIFVVWGGRNQSEERYDTVTGVAWLLWLVLCVIIHGGKYGGVKTKLDFDRRSSFRVMTTSEQEQYQMEMDDNNDVDDDGGVVEHMPVNDEDLKKSMSDDGATAAVESNSSGGGTASHHHQDSHDANTGGSSATTHRIKRRLPSMKVWRSQRLSSMHDSSRSSSAPKTSDHWNQGDGDRRERGHDDDEDEKDEKDALAVYNDKSNHDMSRNSIPSAAFHTLLADHEDKSLWQLFREKMGASCICCGCCKCCCRRTTNNNNNSKQHDDDENRVAGRQSSGCERFWDGIKWIVSIMVNLFCLFCLIVCIGASAQGRITKDHYEPTNIAIYGEGIDNGPVCAMDDIALTDQGDIRTFPNRDAAHLANYTILHCGACAACSTWWDLEQEYCTRNNLAERSQKCAAKAIFDLNGSLDCTLDIFPGEACAKCWVDDYKCVHRYCMFLGLQAVLINALLNFEVAEGVITPANCEEANCEGPDYGGGERVPFNGYWGGFVKCSGATRRRMNVQSSIKRPASDMCSIVDVDYEALFGPCG